MNKKRIIRSVAYAVLGVGLYFGIRYAMFTSMLSEESQKAATSSPAQEFKKDRLKIEVKLGESLRGN